VVLPEGRAVRDSEEGDTELCESGSVQKRS
jgi:hypothetical protein